MKRIFFAPFAKTSASFAVSAFRLFVFISILATQYPLLTHAQILNSTGGKITISGGAMTVKGKMLMDTASVIQNNATLKTDTLKNAGDIRLTGNAAQLVIDSGMILQKGELQLNSNKLVLLNGDTNALQVTEGKLLLGDSLLGSVVWNVADNTGKYVVPFSDSLGDVFVELKILQAGDSLGQFTFSTYQTENDNAPLPAAMGDDAARMILETPLKITDRFWKVEAENYNNIPTGKLKVTYLVSEAEGDNVITIDSLVLSRWDGNCWKKLDGEIDSASRTYQTDTTASYGVLALHERVIPTLCNDGNNCDYAYLLLETDADDITYEMSDTIYWYKFTAKNTVFDFSAYQFDSPDFHINKIKLFRGNCSSPTELAESVGSDSTDYMYLRYDSLEVGEKYFMAVYQEGSEVSEFKVKLRFLNENYWNILHIRIEDAAYLPELAEADNPTTVTFPDADMDKLVNDFGIFWFQRANPTAWLIEHILSEELKKSYLLVFYGNEEILKQKIIAVDSINYKSPTVLKQSNSLFHPNDYYSSTTAFGNSDWLDQIRADDAWDITTGSEKIEIAIVEAPGNATNKFDSGHEDLADNMVRPPNRVSQNINNFPTSSDRDHATSVAGFASAVTNNDLGIAAPGYNSKLDVILFSPIILGVPYYPDIFPLVTKADAILQAVINGNQVINNSYVIACESESSLDGVELRIAIQIAYDKNVVVIAGAGNGNVREDGSQSCEDDNGNYILGYVYPASFDHVISVGGISKSNLYEGPAYTFTFNERVDITAPAHRLTGLAFTGWGDNGGNYYRDSRNGTSFASPITAGVAALILSINPCLTPDDVEYILKASANTSPNSNLANQAYLGLSGAGLLDAYAACSLAENYKTPTDPIISVNTVWTTPQNIAATLTVESGVTLTISTTVRFKENAKLVVEQGGKLVVHHGTLTNCAANLWQGIVVEGNSTKAQPSGISKSNAETFTLASNDHGVVVLRDGATIEYAEIGIQLGTSSKTGGILFADDAVFIDNEVAVYFASSNIRNKSIIVNSEFITDGLLASAYNTYPEAFVFIDVLKYGNPFFGNNVFKNIALETYKPEDRGAGIIAYGAFRAHGYKVVSGSYNASRLQNRFEHLTYGIQYYNLGTLLETKISRNIFINNSRGILLSHADYAVVTLNEITLGPAMNEGINLPYGIYVQGSTGFAVEENNIAQGVQVKNYGIYVDRTGITSEEVYKNQLDFVYHTLSASETNDNTQFLCNEMNDAEYHIAVFEGATIALDQGNCMQELPPAGNTFSTCNTSLTYAHIYNDNDNRLFRYWFEPNGNEEPSSTCASPNVRLERCEDFSSSCPSKINYFVSNPPTNPGVITGHTGTCIICINDNIGDHRMGLHNDWENLRTMVNGYSLSASVIKDSLINQGNRLIDEILLDALIKKQEEDDNQFFSDVQLRNILVANAPNSQKVMRAVYERIPAISGDVLPQIEAAQDSPATGRLDTMNIIYALEHEKHIIYNTFIRYALEDSNDITLDQVIDSLILETDIESQTKLIETYLTIDSLDDAGEMLDSIKLYNNELRQYHKLTKLYLELRNDDKSWLDADSNMIDDLWDIVETRTKSSVKAQNVLSLLLDTTFAELIEEVEEGGSPKTGNTETRKPLNEKISTPESLIKIYPNPAKDEIIIELPESDSDWQLKIAGILGSSTPRLFIESDTRKFVFSLKDFPNGIYLLNIDNSEGINCTKKLVVIK